MHQIIRSIKRILPSDLPTVRDAESGALRPATEAELLNLGIVSLGHDLYSCNEQLRSDDEKAAALGTRDGTWEPHGEPIPGDVLSSGDVRERHAKLPAAVRAQVMRADVFRATDPTANAKALVTANLAEQQAAVDANVGAVLMPTGAPIEGADGSTPLAMRLLVDLSTPGAVLAEAQRVAELPDSGVAIVRVAMAEINESSDLIRADNLVPHTWAGERG